MLWVKSFETDFWPSSTPLPQTAGDRLLSSHGLPSRQLLVAPDQRFLHHLPLHLPFQLQSLMLLPCACLVRHPSPPLPLSRLFPRIVGVVDARCRGALRRRLRELTAQAKQVP